MNETELIHLRSQRTENVETFKSLNVPTFVRTPLYIALAYLAALIVAETFTALLEPRAGLTMHGLILIGLLIHAALTSNRVHSRFLIALALAPLIRLLSLTLPLPNYPFVYWYMVVGAPLVLAVLIAAGAVRVNRIGLGLTARALPEQLLVGVTGIGLGYIEYLILRPEPLVEAFRLELLWLPALILLVFTGFLEELIFRGLIQYAAIRSLGRFGLVYVALVFAVLHLGYQSALDVVFVFFVALFFGLVVLKTGSIWGVTLSHGLTNIALFLIFPFVLAGTSGAPAAAQPSQASGMELVNAPFLDVAGTSVQTPPAPSPTSTGEAGQTLLSSSTPLSPPASPTSYPVANTPEIPSSPIPPSDTPEPTPTATYCGPPPGWVLYTVRAGDTLYGLSQETGTSVTMLQFANCLTGDMIYIGQALYLPSLPPHALPTSTVTASSTPSPTATDEVAPSPTAPAATEEATPNPTEPTETATLSLTPSETVTSTPAEPQPTNTTETPIATPTPAA